MQFVRRLIASAGVAAIGAMLASCVTSAPVRLAGADCVSPPPLHCPETGCAGAIVTEQGAVTEPKTGRKLFLDYPCDLRQGEDVVFILSIHGGGSYGNWHRHYFPAFDIKDKYRLVIATPNSPGGNWRAENDDQYLRNIVDMVMADIGRENIKSFWLVGHSAGSAAARRIVCDDYFKTKVDGLAAVSGGRIAPLPARTTLPTAAPRPEGAAGPPAPPAGATPRPAAPAAGGGGPPGAGMPTCDFSFIYTIGSNEIGGPIPETSNWAEKYGCRPRTTREIVDAKGGYVYDTSARNTPVQLYRGGPPTGGTTDVYLFDGCKEGRIVADFLRRGKGHTQGHEPVVTEEVVKLMLKAKGGKIRDGG
jgi:hypothetical protein